MAQFPETAKLTNNLVTLKYELNSYWSALSTECCSMLFIFTVTRLMAEQESSILTLGIFGGISSMSYAVGAAIGGRLSDLWSVRQVITLGTIIQIMAMLACIQWHASNHSLYLIAALSGSAIGFIHPPIIAGLTKGGLTRLGTKLTSTRLYRYSLSWNLGLICGQTGGGWLFPINPTLPLIAGVLLMLGVLILVRLNHTSTMPVSETMYREASVVPKEARTFVYLGWLANISGAMGMSTIIHLFPHLAHELAISPPVHGIMLAANRIMVVITYSLMHSLTFWRYRFSATLLVQLSALIGLILLTYGRTVIFLTIGLLLFALLTGFNYFSSIFYSTTSFSRTRQGMVSGLHEASLAFGFAAGAFGGGIVGLRLGSRGPYQMVAVVLVLTALIQFGVYINMRRHQNLRD